MAASIAIDGPASEDVEHAMPGLADAAVLAGKNCSAPPSFVFGENDLERRSFTLGESRLLDGPH
jgi:hypothetical protein